MFVCRCVSYVLYKYSRVNVRGELKGEEGGNGGEEQGGVCVWGGGE